MVGKRSSRPSQEIPVSQIWFVGEQDGPPERFLKERLLTLFKQRKEVARAYLAMIEYGSQHMPSVALCLKTQEGADKGLVDAIGAIFASVFGAHEHLDIVFVTEDQEAELAKVCKPFLP